ncbi:type IX secretion system protein PorQ [Lutibacter sp. TH_r2]|uniref:type IX secretion system protein PorQ n=1 Tax=Lutibacter sp. TH_r2 TaxID=3082083 RepID=UPI0029532410|nr:type IX secretion system protein PorQ [Lutibacter sp. TH_r2]MDV7188254.1 type IX secretion system protein PorQ [Lutibacter sp. TH_r2]
MKKIIYFILLNSCLLSAQVGGESIYNFLNLSTSARQAALGGKAITLLDDVNQPLWNPATISNKIDNKIGLNYMNFLADVNLITVSYAHMINRNVGTFHTGISYLSYGKFIGADENGTETGTFKAYDLAFSLGYAYNILYSDFYVGANLKMINSVIDNYSSFGVGADLGLLFYNEHLPYSLSLALRNIGYQVTLYDEERENLPFEIQLGASYKLENVPITWHVTIDNLQQWKVAYANPSNTTTTIDGEENEESINFLDNAFRHLSVGAEIFPEGLFNLRVGYNFRRAKELLLNDKRTFSGFTAGFGLQMRRIKFNYAFAKYHPASNSSTFSLIIDLN